MACAAGRAQYLGIHAARGVLEIRGVAPDRQVEARQLCTAGQQLLYASCGVERVRLEEGHRNPGGGASRFADDGGEACAAGPGEDAAYDSWSRVARRVSR